MAQLLEVAGRPGARLLVFSGSGLSATSGMSMFTTRDGLYERARKQFKIADGMRLFSYGFYRQRKADVQARARAGRGHGHRRRDPLATAAERRALTRARAPPPTAPRRRTQAFFAQIYSEAQASRASPGHGALAALAAAGRLRRHYTMNIDGLSGVVGMDTWHWTRNPEGLTVEMHGNIGRARARPLRGRCCAAAAAAPLRPAAPPHAAAACLLLLLRVCYAAFAFPGLRL